MCNFFTRNFRLCAIALLALFFLAVRALAVSNEVRFTSVSAASGQWCDATVAGLQSAVSNGCPVLSLAFSDSLGRSCIWPGGFQWRTDYQPVAMHVFDPSKNYQRFSGAHFWRAVCTSQAVEVVDWPAWSFSPGDGTGYRIVETLGDVVASRVYPFKTYRDGAFIYADFDAPHWLVWTTNSGAVYQTGWPFINVPIGTSDTYTFRQLPIQWKMATRAPQIAEDEDFELLPGSLGVMPAFYLARTETTEATTAAVISNGVAKGLFTAAVWEGTAGRGALYPETGRTLAEALALCNLATRLHNDVTGEALGYVYTLGGAPFFVAPSNAVASVQRDPDALGYRLPTRQEYAYAAAGDGRTVFPWGNNKAYEWYYATNGLPVTETVLTEPHEMDAFYEKYHLVTTNSTANFLSKNGARHVSNGRVSAVRSQYRSWSQAAVNTNGQPVIWLIAGFSGPMYFGDKSSDGAWGVGTKEVHDLAGNVAEMVWPPVVRPWGAVRVGLAGGGPSLDSAFAQSGVESMCSASSGRSTVGFRFARNKRRVQP